MVKRSLVCLFLFLAVFFLSACGTPRPQRTSFTYTGKISQAGETFILETDDDRFIVRSTFLAFTPYLNKKVKVHGQFSQDVFFVDDVKPAAN